MNGELKYDKYDYREDAILQLQGKVSDEILNNPGFRANIPNNCSYHISEDGNRIEFILSVSTNKGEILPSNVTEIFKSHVFRTGYEGIIYSSSIGTIGELLPDKKFVTSFDYTNEYYDDTGFLYQRSECSVAPVYDSTLINYQEARNSLKSWTLNIYQPRDLEYKSPQTAFIETENDRKYNYSKKYSFRSKDIPSLIYETKDVKVENQIIRTREAFNLYRNEKDEITRMISAQGRIGHYDDQTKKFVSDIPGKTWEEIVAIKQEEPFNYDSVFVPNQTGYGRH